MFYSDTFAYVPGSRLYASITRTTAADSQKTAYTYDAWERLLTVTEPTGRKTEYEYDPFGNRTREKISNVLDPEATGGSPKEYGDYVYEYPAKSNRLSRILKDNVQLEAYTYDNAGRLTQRIHATEGTTTYSYDARGLLTQVTRPGTTISYTYDALGARKSKTVNGTTTKYLTAPLFGMSRVIAELNNSLSIQATYVYGGQQLLKEEPTFNNRSHDVYLLSDGIVGSITHATDSGGQVKDEYGYDAFGIRSATSQTSSSHGHYGYTGQEYDEEAGLLYLRARYYDPRIGRFISADPFWGRLEEPASQNRYVYVKSNPLIYTDPSGLDWFRPDGHPYMAGREGTIIEPGPNGVGKYVDDYVPGGHTFASMHDNFVGSMTELGLPDWLVNIPSMAPAYLAALATETADSILGLFGFESSHKLEHDYVNDVSFGLTIRAGSASSSPGMFSAGVDSICN